MYRSLIRDFHAIHFMIDQCHLIITISMIILLINLVMIDITKTTYILSSYINMTNERDCSYIPLDCSEKCFDQLIKSNMFVRIHMWHSGKLLEI